MYHQKLKEKNQEQIIAAQAAEIKILKDKLASYEQYIAENEAMRSEQIIAEQIQLSMLPTDYPAFPEHPDIDLFADTDTAREVGGDFYDYFAIDNTHLCFGISDVEGKGIPAAMHMAVAKTMIKMRVRAGENLGDIFTDINRLFCKSRMQNRFITSWIGVLNVETGKMHCVNAGHNYPLLRRADGAAELIKTKSGLPLAAYYSPKISNDYKVFEMNLNKGDMLLLYTDGVTEAQDATGRLWGTERLIEAVNLYMADNHSMKELTAYIRRRVAAFANHVDQDDDITILAIKIK